MKPLRILVVLESRSTYGYSRSVIEAIQAAPELELLTLVTGMHFVQELGMTIDVIRRDGFDISATTETGAPDSTPASWARTLGRGVNGAADALEKLAPDIVLLFGDRVETFAVGLAATYMGIVIAHVQAGDKSGHVDDPVRMAMAKLVHVHFASCEDSANRLRRLGEQEFRIHTVGAPQLDLIVGRDFQASSIDLHGKTYSLKEPYLLMLQHPLMLNHEEAGNEFRATLSAALGTGLRVFAIYPNSDLGFRQILDEIRVHSGNDKLVAFSNVERDPFLYLLANSAALVGNSSVGILEAPTLKIPVVNIGERQRGRQQASNIVNAEMNEQSISAALKTVLHDAEFKCRCQEAVNPYGDGKSAERIVKVLSSLKIDATMRDKLTVY